MLHYTEVAASVFKKESNNKNETGNKKLLSLLLSHPTHFLLEALHAGEHKGITKGDHTHIYATVVKFTLSV